MSDNTGRVLILDDNLDTLELLRIRFEGVPYRVDFFSASVEAMIAILQGYLDYDPYTILVLDCALPKIDGFTVAKCVRMWEGTNVSCRSKIAFFTSYSGLVESSTLLAEVHADQYWRKPDQMLVLPDLIAKWLGHATEDAAE